MTEARRALSEKRTRSCSAAEGPVAITLNNGVTPEEIVEAFIQLEAYAGAARAFDSYRIAREVFTERATANPPRGEGS